MNDAYYVVDNNLVVGTLADVTVSAHLHTQTNRNKTVIG